MTQISFKTTKKIIKKKKKNIIIIISIFYKSFNPRDAIIIHILKEKRMNDSLIASKLQKKLSRFLKREIKNKRNFKRKNNLKTLLIIDNYV